jgi:glycosyltransferase involved in cell wall biosynthesis
MKILLNAPELSLPGGVAKYCSTIRAHFKNEVTYFTVGRRGSADRLFAQLATALHDYRSFWSALPAVELVHLNPSLQWRSLTRDGLFLLLAKMRGKKVVVFIHGWDEQCESRIRRFFLCPFRLVYFRADALVVLAAVFREKLAAMGCRREIHLETTSVEAAMFPQGAALLACRREKKGQGGLHVLYLSRIERQKGIYEAIDSYSLLKARFPKAELTVVGDGSELGAARDYVASKRIADVHFEGYLTGAALRGALAAADVYLFPTWHGEGLPISVLEAMVFGLPVLTRPVGGIPDFFEDGRMGFLLESKDPANWAAKLELLACDRDLVLAMGEYNHRYAEGRFRPDHVVTRLEAIYGKVMAVAAN